MIDNGQTIEGLSLDPNDPLNNVWLAAAREWLEHPSLIQYVGAIDAPMGGGLNSRVAYRSSEGVDQWLNVPASVAAFALNLTIQY